MTDTPTPAIANLNRRHLLASGATGLALACLSGLAEFGAAPARAADAAPTAVPGAAPNTPASAEDTRLATLLDRIMAERLDRSPELATSLGLDSGARASEKARLDDRSLAAWGPDKARTARQRADLAAINRDALTGLNRSNYDSVLFEVAVADDFGALPYIGAPYAVSQLTGAYQSVPDFLDSQHAIANRDDAEAYLSRLAGFATAIYQESEQVRHDAGLGVTPPDFILGKTLTQLKDLAATPAATAVLVQSLVRRTHDLALAGDWEARATKLYTEVVQPALGRQIALIEGLAGKAVHTAGVGRLPQGEALYALSLKSYTTSSMAPAEIHQTGLDLIAQQSAEIDTILKAQGFTQGSVGARLHGLYTDPRYQYPDTDAGKAALLAYLNGLVAEVTAKLPAWFATLPKAQLTIKRVPSFTEAGAPGGYYQPGTLDGSRAGAYYINLRTTTEHPRWLLPTLTFHEGIPGHHLQLSLAQEADLPLIRKSQFFSGYGEGWALYSEQLAVEMGMYDDNPLGRVGQLHDAMFRAVRLVVDSGMHHMGWSRERAIAFYTDTLGDKESAAATEVERYCVWPGQACSYMLGKLEWLRLRAKARAALGDRFAIGKFHDAGLLAGAMPLPALAARIEDYIAASKA